jgi:tetratricopeptide (TPR) repeat protein
MSSARDFEKAMELVREGLQFQMAGDLERAMQLYRASIRICPTADAHTYLGWAYSFQGKLDEAIAHCMTAISIDPDFGNPYNDIGVYLMQQNRTDEAIPWLEKAKRAARYEPRHFPYLNLGRIYASRGMLRKALEEFKGALALNPEDELASRAIQELESKLQ